MKTFLVTYFSSTGSTTDEVQADSLIGATAAVCRFLGDYCSDVTFNIVPLQ